MQHFYENIQGWTKFGELYQRVVSEAPHGALFAEVGCWLGRSAALMGVEIINADKDLHLYCIDHWKGSVEHKDVPADLYEQFLANIAPVKSVITPVRGDSAKTAEKFPDRFFHFVFIDAGHEFDDVAADIEAWLPKVAPGGLIAGDDYGMQGVKSAVDELLPNAKLGNVGDWPYWFAHV